MTFEEIYPIIKDKPFRNPGGNTIYYVGSPVGDRILIYWYVGPAGRTSNIPYDKEEILQYFSDGDWVFLDENEDEMDFKEYINTMFQINTDELFNQLDESEEDEFGWTKDLMSQDRIMFLPPVGTEVEIKFLWDSPAGDCEDFVGATVIHSQESLDEEGDAFVAMFDESGDCTDNAWYCDTEPSLENIDFKREGKRCWWVSPNHEEVYLKGTRPMNESEENEFGWVEDVVGGPIKYPIIYDELNVGDIIEISGEIFEGGHGYLLTLNKEPFKIIGKRVDRKEAKIIWLNPRDERPERWDEATNVKDIETMDDLNLDPREIPEDNNLDIEIVKRSEDPF